MASKTDASKPLNESEPPPMPQGKLTKLKKFDVYGRVKKDHAVKTKSGGLISIIALAIMASLFVTEIQNYLTVEIVDNIIVDTTLNQKLPISLNITFPRIRCSEVSVDTVDSMGENQVDNKGRLLKVDLDGNMQPSKGETKAGKGECWSCMAATNYVKNVSEEHDACCNSCDELKQAYMDADLESQFAHVSTIAQQCKQTVGCGVSGDVLVSKVAGNVHVALGRSKVRNGKLVHEFRRRDVSGGFNTSHKIHRLEFGDQVSGMLSPLDACEKIVQTGAYMFHYYIKLVPTLFEGRDKVVYTHQYSVTEKAKDVMTTGELQGLPGVFFVYEFTPFMVHKTENIMPLSHFFTSLCAIIGGVFTVAGRVDAILYKSYKKLGKSTE